MYFSGKKKCVFYGKTDYEFLFAFDVSAVWDGKSQFHGSHMTGRPGKNKIINTFVLKLYVLEKNFPFNFRLKR